MTVPTPADDIQISYNENGSKSAVHYGTRLEFLANGNIEIYSRKPVQVKKAADMREGEKLSDSEVGFGKAFAGFLFMIDVKDVRVEETSNGYVIYTDRRVDVKHDIDPLGRIIGEPAEEKNGYAYVGTLEDGRDVYAAPEDIGIMTQRKGKKAIRKLNRQEGTSVHMPDEAELTLIFKAKATLAGLHDEGTRSDAGLYWASEREKGFLGFGSVVNMRSGDVYHEGRGNKRSIRPVQN